MIDFEFAFRYAEAKQTALQKAAGSIPAGRCVVLCGGERLRQDDAWQAHCGLSPG